MLSNACASVGLDNCIESNLDFQYIMAVGQNIPTISIYVNNSCNWLSLVQFVQNMKNPPKVLSISYSSYEEEISSSYLTSFNNGMIQLGVMGVTFFASSGDDGAVGWRVTQTSQCNTYGYSPQFPASSPYVTSVGGTQVCFDIISLRNVVIIELCVCVGSRKQQNRDRLSGRSGRRNHHRRRLLLCV